VEPLDHPDPLSRPDLDALRNFDSVTLFLDRAKSVVRGFAPTRENAGALAAICARLDGLPLAIELAASQVKLLDPQQILDMLDDRLPEISGPRNLPERQRTLRATIEWSTALLDGSQQQLLSRLGVFAGGFTLEAMEAVCDPLGGLGIDPLEGLSTLIDGSLVRRIGSPGVESRFTMLESIRAFAKGSLDAGDDARATYRRHAEYYLALCEEAEPYLVGDEQADWFLRLERELDNIRIALGFCIEEGLGEMGVRMASAIWRFWARGIHTLEGRRWLEQVMDLPDISDSIRWKGLNALAGVVYWLPDHQLAESMYRESLSLAEKIGDPRAEMEALYNVGVMALVLRRDSRGAEELFERALPLAREFGEGWEGRIMVFRASAAHMLGDYDEAVRLSQGAADLLRGSGNRWELAIAYNQLGDGQRLRGDLEAARNAYQESLQMLWGAGNLLMAARVMKCMAALLVAEGSHETGVRLVGAAEHILEMAGSLSPASGIDFGDPIGEAQLVLGKERVDELLEEGRAWSPEHSVAFALEDP
jgi:tetratricopeptide (TPR) repeat protein